MRKKQSRITEPRPLQIIKCSICKKDFVFDHPNHIDSKGNYCCLDCWMNKLEKELEKEFKKNFKKLKKQFPSFGDGICDDCCDDCCDSKTRDLCEMEYTKRYGKPILSISDDEERCEWRDHKYTPDVIKLGDEEE